MWHHLLQSNWWNSNIANFHSHWRGNRHAYGSSGRRQNTKHAIPVDVPSTIPDGMWKDARCAEQHGHTVRQRSISHCTTLLKATATAMGSNIAVRQSPTYTSQAQGSVERFHRTLMGQVRALKLQLENNYNTRLTSKHPIMPWMVKHAAYLLNRYAVHADGNTSYYRRWNKEHKTPICEFGEAVLYTLPTAKLMPKMEARFFPAIWLGKDTSTNENILGISNKVIRSRTIRRQVKPENYNRQLLDVINNTPMTTPTASSFVPLPTAKMMTRPQTTTGTQTTAEQGEAANSPTEQQTKHKAPTPAIADAPMATAPSTQPAKTPLPLPTSKRGRWNYGRKRAKATTDSNTTNRSSQTGNSSRTTSNKTKDLSSLSQDKEWTSHQGAFQRRWTRSDNRKDPTWTLGPKHRRTWQGTDNRRNETRSKINESATGLHRGILQQPHTRTTKQSDQVKMGSTTKRQQRQSKDRGKRIHRRSQRQRRHLRFNTDLLCPTPTTHNGSHIQLDCQNRWHFNSIPTR